MIKEGVQKVFGTLDLFVSLLETEIKYPILQGGILPFWTPSFVLYIKFTNQTYRSVYEFPEFAEYGKLISFAFVIVVATTDDLGIDIETL